MAERTLNLLIMDDSGRNTNVEGLVAPLFESMKVRVTDEELQRIKDAFAFAREAHKEQRRKSGEPYIVHPISVARIVGEEMMLDAHFGLTISLGGTNRRY